MAGFHDFKITSDGPVFKSQNTHVYLDGAELKGVKSVRLALDAWDVSTIEIEFYANQIDVSVPALLEYLKEAAEQKEVWDG